LLVRNGPLASRFAFLRVEEHEVDVGGDIELAAAELAERRDDKSLGLAVEILRFAMALHGRLMGMRHRGSHRDLRERRHRRDDFVERREAVEVAMGEVEEDALAQLPQPHGDVLGGRSREGGLDLLSSEGAGAALFEIVDDLGPGLRDAGGVERKPQGRSSGVIGDYNTVTSNEDRRIKALPRICLSPRAGRRVLPPSSAFAAARAVASATSRCPP
jgi:hypothetical protein